MSLPDFSVRRPIAVLMVTLAVSTFGFLASRQLPVELLPDLSYPTLTIQTVYPDAAPVSVEQFVTRPVEEAVGVIPGVRDMRSTSRAGLSEVVLEFGWDTEMDFAGLDVREKLGLVQLPQEAEPPRVLRFDPSLDPIVRLALSGDRSLDDLRQVAELWIKPRLEAVRGVASAKVRGGLDPEIHVDVDEDRLAEAGLTIEDLSRALEAENVNQPGGTLKDFNAVYLVRTLHEFDDPEMIRRTVVRETPRGRVRVEDVATVTRGHRDRDEITRSDGREVVEIALHREGSANTVTVAASIRDELASLQTSMPEDLTLTVLTDQSVYISDAISQVWSAALIGGILAILVLYFFLGDASSTAIIALSIPISVLAAFLPMQRAGVSLNIMSLGGLALGVGMLVDNSIVVLEAIDRHRREGRSRREASSLGAGEVASAVTASTLTTVCVFFPIVFVRGIAGQLFYDQAVTVCFSLLASLIVSLTLIPALAAIDPVGARRYAFETLFRWDRGAVGAADLPWTVRIGGWSLPPLGNGRHWLSRSLTVLFFLPRVVLLGAAIVCGAVWWLIRRTLRALFWPATSGFDTLARAYPGVLSRALRRRWIVLAAAFLIFALSIAVLPLLGTNLVPDLSQGEFAFRLRLPDGTPLESTSEIVARIEEPLLADGRFERVFSVVGSLPSAASGRQTLGENLAQINFALPGRADPGEEAAGVERVRDVLARFPEAEAELVHPSVLSFQPPVAVRVFSDDLDVLQAATRKTEDLLRQVTGVVDVSSTWETGSPEIRVEMDRERAAALGVTAETIGESLRRKIRGEIVGKLREGEQRLDIRLRAKESSRERVSDVRSLRLRLPGGGSIPVSAVASVVEGFGPASIRRSGGARMAEAFGKTSATDLGRVIGTLRSGLETLRLPPGARAELAGQDEEIRVSFDSLKLAMALAVFLVYVVMAAQFESLVHPLVILAAVPLGIVGVVLGLGVTSTPVSVLVLIGAVMLAGIVVNNAIVLVDAVNRRRRAGEPLDTAIVAGGRERLRPIMMTTATTVLGLLPMALGLGAGDELRAPLAITVIGGLTVATLLTLLVVPCLYRALSRGEGAAEPASETWAAPAEEALS